MPTALSVSGGVLAPLYMDNTAFAEFTIPRGTPLTRKKNRIHHYKSYFKLYTGLDHGDLSDAGGDLPDIRMYDSYGQHIGGLFDSKEWLAPGSSAILTVKDKDKHSRQPIYTLFTANNNAICVALITTSFAGLGGQYAWLGDLGSGCVGDQDWMGSWYFGGIVVPGTNYYPNCLWIDKDGGQPATAFQIKWPEMVPVENDDRIGKSVNSTGICQTPAFHIHQRYDPKAIIYEEEENDAHGVPVEKPKPEPHPSHTRPRRSVAAAASLRFQQKYGNMLVIDDIDSHRADILCESSSSQGPSFLNPKDGFFCDMRTKTVYPACLPQNHTNVCFDLEQNELVGPGLQKRSVPFQIQDWRINRGKWVSLDEDTELPVSH